MADKTLLLKGTGAFTLCSGLLETGKFVRMPTGEKSSLKIALSEKKSSQDTKEDPEDKDPDWYDAPGAELMSGYKVMGQSWTVSIVVTVLQSHSADFQVGTPVENVIPVECRGSRKRTMDVLNEIRAAF